MDSRWFVRLLELELDAVRDLLALAVVLLADCPRSKPGMGDVRPDGTNDTRGDTHDRVRWMTKLKRNEKPIAGTADATGRIRAWRPLQWPRLLPDAWGLRISATIVKIATSTEASGQLCTIKAPHITPAGCGRAACRIGISKCGWSFQGRRNTTSITTTVYTIYKQRRQVKTHRQCQKMPPRTHSTVQQSPGF